MDLDLADIPLSRRGSYMAVSFLGAERAPTEGVWLRSIRDLFGCGPVFRLETAGKPVSYRPECLTVAGVGGQVDITFDGADTMRLRLRGGRLRLQGGRHAFEMLPAGQGRWRVVLRLLDCFWWVTPLRGRLTADAPWTGKECSQVHLELTPEEGEQTAELAIYETVGTELLDYRARDFDVCTGEIRDELEAFGRAQLAVPSRYAPAAQVAAYLNWSCLVAPRGHLRREAMYMSKNWMTAVWSWDHCLNALALSRGDPALAFDQFMLLLELQNEQGCLPGLVSDRAIYWRYVKPPIHGWTLARLMEACPDFYTPERLAEAYDALCRQTEYWLGCRDPFGTGLPAYWHGNDSGWDNSTVMLAGSPVEAADCGAYLVVQAEVLADLADRLGKGGDRARWREMGATLYQRLVSRLWKGDRFVMPPLAGEALPAAAGADSLLPYMTVFLGRRLEREKMSALVAGLSEPGRFLTRWGLATESLRSPHYEADGYWRGPIWAPSTLIAVAGLADANYPELAGRLAEAFCDLCAANGFAENFDAVSGVGLRDRAYTWTASAFLWLASRLES